LYNHLQEILNKTNKNYYIVLWGDLKVRILNSDIQTIVGCFGEPVINTSGLKLRV